MLTKSLFVYAHHMLQSLHYHSPDSPILDFYPADFKIDANGKRNPWEAVSHMYAIL
jgi:5'-3' exonuclease